MRGVTVRIVDHAGGDMPDGQIGDIVISGDCVGRRIGAGGALAPPEPINTGDLGFFRDGHLHVAGRSVDLIILRGQNVFPTDVEAATLAAGASIVGGGAAAVGVEADGTQHLVVLAELDRTVRLDAAEQAALRRTITERVVAATGHSPRNVQLLPYGRLPRTSSGKIRRRAAAALYLDSLARRAAVAAVETAP